MIHSNLVFKAQSILYHIFDFAVKDKFEVIDIATNGENNIVSLVEMSDRNNRSTIVKIDIPQDLQIVTHEYDGKKIFNSLLKGCSTTIAV